jgi:hypothetical protein
MRMRIGKLDLSKMDITIPNETNTSSDGVRVVGLQKSGDSFYYNDKTQDATRLFNFFALTHIPIPTTEAITDMQEMAGVCLLLTVCYLRFFFVHL